MPKASDSTLTREDLDNAVSRALQQALGDIGQKVCAEVRTALDAAVSDIKDACAIEKEDNVLLGGTLSVTPNQSRTLAMKYPSQPLSDASPRSSGQQGYAPLIEPDAMSGSMVQSRESSRPQYKSAAMKALEAFQRRNALSQEEWTLHTLVTHSHFEQVTGVVVILNCLFLATETQMACINNGKVPATQAPLVELVEFIFCILFSTEIGMRVAVRQVDFFTAEDWKRNWFDLIIVSMQVLEQILYFSKSASQSSHALTRFVSMARIFRLARIVRIMRILHLFPELRARINSIAESMSSLVWTLVLLLIVNFGFSVFFTMLTMDANTKEGNEQLATFFGTFPRTSLTLLECIIGGVDWDEPLVLLQEGIGITAIFFFVMHETFGVFVLLNMIMGIFIDKAIKVAQDATEMETACAITGAFLGDQAYTQAITWDVFEQKIQDPLLAQSFRAIGVDIQDARCLFDLLDTDRSGSIDAQEIVEGCLRLKGSAKALDMALNLRVINQLAEKMDAHVLMVSDHVDSVSETLTDLCKRMRVPKNRSSTTAEGAPASPRDEVHNSDKDLMRDKS